MSERYEPPPRTYREVCEYIAAWVKRMGGPDVPWRDIYEISPTGELWPVFDLYWSAICGTEGVEMRVDPATFDITFVRAAAA